MKVSICISTYRRPEGIRRLLTALESLELPGAEIEVVVVDNADEPGVSDICTAARSTLKWPLHFGVESRRGISHARNRALDLASDTSDWIAIIDDDEVPGPRWLAELLRVQEETGADVVTGPVSPHFEEGPADWVEAGGFFDRRHHLDGAPILKAYTHNVIFRASLLRDARLMPAFAERYSLTGGGDDHFFRRVRMAGYSIHWADSAVVTEWIPANRTTASWLVRRQFRIGNASAAIEAELEPGVGRRLRSGARACKEIVFALASMPLAGIRGTAAWVLARQRAAFSLGMIWGLLGRSYEEYR